MKKITALLIALALIVAMACPVFADEFEASPTPADLVELVEFDGYVGIIRDANGEEVARVPAGCLEITSLNDVREGTKEVSEELAELLEKVNEDILSGELELPYEKHGENLADAEMVLCTVFELHFTCEEHKAMLEQEGYTLEVSLKVGVDPDVIVYTMVCDDETEEWDPIVSTVNNNDGTVTCVFDKLCVIEFSVEATEA